LKRKGLEDLESQARTKGNTKNQKNIGVCGRTKATKTAHTTTRRRQKIERQKEKKKGPVRD